MRRDAAKRGELVFTGSLIRLDGNRSTAASIAGTKVAGFWKT